MHEIYEDCNDILRKGVGLVFGIKKIEIYVYFFRSFKQ